jgi:hypothetical protein
VEKLYLISQMIGQKELISSTILEPRKRYVGKVNNTFRNFITSQYKYIDIDRYITYLLVVVSF